MRRAARALPAAFLAAFLVAPIAAAATSTAPLSVETFFRKAVYAASSGAIKNAKLNPVDNADKVGAPILLAYGASDRRVIRHA